MKTNIVRMIIGTILIFFMIPPIFCQLPKRVVSYTTLQQQHFSLPANIEIGQVNSLDFNKMISQDNSVTTEISIDHSNNPTITTTYHVSPRYFNDYENEITKSITKNGETILYDYNNIEVKRKRHNPDEDMDVVFRDEDVKKYGIFNHFFSTNPNVTYNYFYQNGFDVRFLANSNTVVAVSNDVEILINFRDYIYEIRYFEDREFMQSITNYYQCYQGIFIPHSTVTNSISDLDGGIHMLTTTIVTYLEYRVIDDKGKDVVHFISKEEVVPKREIKIGSYEEITKRELQLKVFPNPATDQVTVMIPFFMETESTLEIINNYGTVIYKIDNIKGPSQLLDVSSFVNGIYFIRCTGDGEQVTTKFVKQ